MLEIAQIKQIIEGEIQGQKKQLKQAKAHEERLCLHSEITVSDQSRGAVTQFLDGFVANMLPFDKLYTFKHLFRFPVRTVPLVERIYTAIGKIFDGRNPVFSYEFTSPEHAQDWDAYRTKELRVMEKWESEGLEYMKTKINSLVVVDLPQEQASTLPEPYFYFLELDDVINLEVVKGDQAQLDWVIFETNDNRVAVYDDTYYRIFEKKKGSNEIDWSAKHFEVSHDLGYCPVRFFWTSPINMSQKLIKCSPTTPLLSDMDMLLYYIIGTEHLQTYARWPIYVVYATNCDYENHESGHYCYQGFLKDRNGHYFLTREGGPRPCPVCSTKRLEGAGSVVEIEPPNHANQMADYSDPVKVVTTDRSTLEFNNEDNARRAQEIYSAITGFEQTMINEQAINQDQVFGIMEGLESALQKPQTNFELVIGWVDKTLCLLRYGGESFVSASVSLGTEHYILTSDQYMQLYEKAKAANMSTAVLDLLEGLYYETEYKNNPEQLQRQIILMNLDPFRHRSAAEIAALYDKGLVEGDLYMLKANFSTYIMRFERENMTLTEFASGLSFEAKINNISKALLGYAKENRPVAKPVEVE